jgi:GNAT superfamily N-acetyltransferase
MENAFRSTRLIYRALEGNDEDKKFMHESIQLDPVNFKQSDARLFRPQPKRLSDNTTALIAKLPFLSVMLCLPDTSPDVFPSAVKTDTADKSTEDIKDGSEPKLIPIGFICLSDSRGETYQHRSSTLGISIAKSYQGKGYGSEGINWALDWASRFGGLHSIRLHCFSHNPGAMRLYERLGFVQEGRKRESHWFDRAWHDEILYSMLESEWEVLRKI